MPSVTEVGVVVPVHGWAPYLAEALDAVLAQDPAPAAVVVVDDASPEPVALLPEHADRVRVVRRAENGGLAAARATGAEALGTAWVALCDDDDAWRPGRLAAQLRALEGAGGDVVAVFGRAEVVGPDGRPTGETWELPPAPGLPLLFERNPLCASSALLRTDAVAAAGGFASGLRRAEDWDLWLRLLAGGGRLVGVPGAVVAYRRRAGALSGDVAALARAGMEVHRRHAGLVDAKTRARVRAADLRALADGLVRERRYAEARAALREAGEGDLRSRVLAGALRVPGARAALGRRDPYRRRR